ncbi:hypothetical protein E4K72_22780 [Oxalobacteraceae bacterium OM1]|nr:hypothetical protein E4K72_22780 [Oxalobacteraceae bacterium OM1]
MKLRALTLACAIAACVVEAAAMEPMSDASLAAVQARDGISFDLNGFAMSGDARITYTAPTGSSLWLGNLQLSRSDDTSNPFGDPYRLDIARGAPGLADMITLAFPSNANGLARWQLAADFGVNADGVSFDGGSLVVRDLILTGGGLELSTPRNGDGFAFGLALRADIGNVLLRPRGRDDITLAEPAGVAEQMNIAGVHIGAVDGAGNFTGAPWRVADLAHQPGVINAVTDANGNPRLHIAIDWPDANGAQWGGIKVDNINFRSDVTGNLDLGSSRIGAAQIQFLDIKVRP